MCVYKRNLKCYQIPCEDFSSFEALTFKLGSSSPVVFAIIYRQPKPAGFFLAEFSDFLSTFIRKYDRIILSGDFNFHVDDY